MQNEADNKQSLTVVEVLIILVVVFFALSFLIGFSLTTERNNSYARLKTHSDEALWQLLQRKNFPSHAKSRAFAIIANRQDAKKLLPKVYAMLIEKTDASSALSNEFIAYLNAHPDAKVAEKLASDYLLSQFPEKIWQQMKSDWASVCLPQALKFADRLSFVNTERDNKRFEFVAEVLSLNQHKLFFKIIANFLKSPALKRDNKKLVCILDALWNYGSSFSDDIFQSLQAIISEDAGTKTDNFDALVEAMTKLMEKHRLQSSAEQFLAFIRELKTGKWTAYKDVFIKALEK